MDERQLWEYNCKDCCATYEIAQELRILTKKMGMEKFVREDELLECDFREIKPKT